MRMLSAHIDWFIADRLKSQREIYRKARQLVLVTQIASLFLFGYTATYFTMGLKMSAFVCFSGALMLIPLFFIFRKSGNFLFTGNVTALVAYLVIVTIISETGGIYSPVIFWLIVPSFAAFLFVNKTSGYTWSVFCVLAIVFFFLAGFYGLNFQHKNYMQWNVFFYFFIALGLVSFLLIYIMLYEFEKADFIRIIKIERKKSDELLLNILPEETANELKEKGESIPRKYDLVTVIFTDFKNFTAIAGQLSAEELIRELNIFFSAFDGIAEKYNLEKIKTIGDAYMCAGGIPVPNTGNPVDAVKAGLEMQAFAARTKARFMDEKKAVWDLRIGIHSGPVIAGVVGSKKFAYDIWGDTVNIASRMESAGAAGKVNISETTYQLVKTQFICSHRGKVAVKNKGEIDMYFVEGQIDQHTGSNTL